jgi:hypothetical protein
MTPFGFMKLTMVDGTIKSEWIYKNNEDIYTGPGDVKGNITETFEGKGEIVSYRPDGKKIYQMEFEIIKAENHYIMNWLSKGRIIYTGVGNLYDGALYCSFIAASIQ